MPQASQGRSIRLDPIQSSDPHIHTLSQQLISLCKPYGINLTNEIATTLVLHLSYVEQVNQYINLTRITSPETGLILHILDSLLLAQFIPDHVKTLLDMGSGPGYPGVPLGLYRALDTTLVDSVNKKVLFDTAVIKQLNLRSFSAIHARLEELPHLTDRFDCVVCRALASLPVLVEYASPLLRMDGYLVVAKGDPEKTEVLRGDKAASICGLTRISINSFSLPKELGHRTVFAFKKIGSSDIRLPRAIGLARKQPLA